MKRIEVSIAKQTLTLWDDDTIEREYLVSTALNGAGEVSGSGQTPLGSHIIRAKIGSNAPRGTVFRGRRATGEIWTPELHNAFPNRDWILSRILWLSGKEPGKNRLGQCDSMRRYIYIHGTPDSEPMGVPLSHGCIRMRNDDVIDLFDRVLCYISVHIYE